MKRTATVLATILALPTCAHAKAYFAPKAEMIAKSDVIAVVDITHVKSLEPEKRHGNQLAEATVREVLKGDAEKGKEMQFKVECFFPCAFTQVSTGQYLVFLSKNGKELRGDNWHLSYRPIKDGTLDWYKDDTSYTLEKRKLEEVLDEVRKIVKKPQQPAGGRAEDRAPRP